MSVFDISILTSENIPRSGHMIKNSTLDGCVKNHQLCNEFLRHNCYFLLPKLLL